MTAACGEVETAKHVITCPDVDRQLMREAALEGLESWLADSDGMGMIMLDTLADCWTKKDSGPRSCNVLRDWKFIAPVRKRVGS